MGAAVAGNRPVRNVCDPKGKRRVCARLRGRNVVVRNPVDKRSKKQIRTYVCSGDYAPCWILGRSDFLVTLFRSPWNQRKMRPKRVDGFKIVNGWRMANMMICLDLVAV